MISLFCATTRARSRTAALLTAALAATGVTLVAPAARAQDATQPALTAISVVGSRAVTAGDPVTFSYAATDDGATLRTAFVQYLDASGRSSYWLLGKDLALSGQATTTVPQGLPNESLRASQVWLADSDGAVVAFRRDGTVCTTTCTAAGHSVDLSALDVLVSGSTVDNAVPVVTALSTPTPTAAVGETVRLDMSMTDTQPLTAQPIALDSATLTSADGYSFNLRSGLDGYTTVSAVVPKTLPDGVYRVSSLRVRDAVGNSASYYTSGAVVKSPTTSTGAATHSIPLTNVTVTVTGSTVDITPPTLTKLSYPTDGWTSGTTATVAFEGVEASSGVKSVKLTYSPAAGSQEPYTWTLDAAVTGEGLASGPIPAVDPGLWNLSSARITDAAGNYTTYYSDGRTCSNRVCPGTHTLDFAAFSATVIGPPGPPTSAWSSTASGTVRLSWSDPDVDGNTAVTGFTVTVSPGGQVYSTSGTTHSLTVSGLTDNTTYTFAIRAKNVVGLSSPYLTSATPRPLQRLFAVGDVSNDGRADIIGMSRAGNDAYIFRGTGTGGIAGYATKVGSGHGNVRALLPSTARPTEDFFHGNTLAVFHDGRFEAWWAYNGDRLTPIQSLAGDLSSFRHIVTPGDFTGDLNADVIVVSDTGDMYLLPGRPGLQPGFSTAKKIGNGWNGFTTIFGAGDFNGDGRNDILARKADGTLWLYAGSGLGGFRSSRQIGTGWDGFAQVTGMADFNGDRRMDVLALAPTGYLYLYKGNGAGGFLGRSLVSTGFKGFV